MIRRLFASLLLALLLLGCIRGPAQTPPTEHELKKTVVEVDGVEGVLRFAPVWRSGALYLHGESLLRLMGNGPMTRDFGGGKLQLRPGYTISARDRTLEMRAGSEPLTPPFPIIVEDRVYLHRDDLLRQRAECTFEWLRVASGLGSALRPGCRCRREWSRRGLHPDSMTQPLLPVPKPGVSIN